jgi:hypothetical protein
MKKALSLMISGLIVFSGVASYADVMTLSEKAKDPEVSIEAEAIKEDVISVNKPGLFDMYLNNSRDSSSKFATAKSTVELVKLAGNQWAVRAKSMARDQDGDMFEIDSIYVKGSLYYKDDDGNWEYKIGDQKTEEHSSDTMVEKVCGIDRRISLAKGNHTYKHAGIKTIKHTTKDYK